MYNNYNIASCEAVLFACGEPVESDRLAEASGVLAEEIDNVVAELNKRYDEAEGGLTILKLNKSYQLMTRKEFAAAIRTAMEAKKDAPLSNAAMEVLTIIAYNQPVSKSFVSHVRGIESGNLVNSLVERELLEEAGRLDVPGKPLAYRTTDVFLRCFGLESLDDLEPLPETIGASDSDNEKSDDENEEAEISNE